MSDLNAYWFLERAHSQLGNASQELNRPSKDIVAFSVCHHSKSIISDLFRSFLLLNGENAPEMENLELLRSACADIDDRFNKIDLGCMDCHPAKSRNDKQYCLNVDRVKSCLQIADEIKVIVDNAFEKREKRKKS